MTERTHMGGEPSRRAEHRLKLALAFLALALGYWAYQAHAIGGVSRPNSAELARVDTSATGYTFAALGDSRNSIRVFRRIMDEINAEGVLFSVHLGDFVYDGDPYRYKYFIGDAAHLEAPLLLVPGNHDLKKGGKIDDAYVKAFGPTDYAFTVGKATFITINNNVLGIGNKRMEWIKGELEKAKGRGPLFVLMHYPLRDPRAQENTVGHSSVDLAEVAELEKLMDAAGVTLALASHIHGYYEGKWGNTPFVITGGGGATLKGTDEKSNIYNYLLVRVDGGNATWEVRAVPPPKSETFDRGLYEARVFAEGYTHHILLAAAAAWAALSLALYMRSGRRAGAG